MRATGYNTFQYSDLDLQAMTGQHQDFFELDKPDEKEFENTFSSEQEKALPE